MFGLLVIIILFTYSSGADRGLYQEYDYNNNLSENRKRYNSDFDSSNVEFIGSWHFGPLTTEVTEECRDHRVLHNHSQFFHTKAQRHEAPTHPNKICFKNC